MASLFILLKLREVNEKFAIAPTAPIAPVAIA
jgi:hypothetical protein